MKAKNTDHVQTSCSKGQVTFMTQINVLAQQTNLRVTYIIIDGTNYCIYIYIYIYNSIPSNLSYVIKAGSNGILYYIVYSILMTWSKQVNMHNLCKHKIMQDNLVACVVCGSYSIYFLHFILELITWLILRRQSIMPSHVTGLSNFRFSREAVISP